MRVKVQSSWQILTLGDTKPVYSSNLLNTNSQSKENVPTDGFQLFFSLTESGEKMLGRFFVAAKAQPAPEHHWNTSSGHGRNLVIILILIHCDVDLQATA